MPGFWQPQSCSVLSCPRAMQEYGCRLFSGALHVLRVMHESTLTLQLLSCCGDLHGQHIPTFNGAVGHYARCCSDVRIRCYVLG